MGAWTRSPRSRVVAARDCSDKGNGPAAFPEGQSDDHRMSAMGGQRILRSQFRAPSAAASSSFTLCTICIHFRAPNVLSGGNASREVSRSSPLEYRDNFGRGGPYPQTGFGGSRRDLLLGFPVMRVPGTAARLGADGQCRL